MNTKPRIAATLGALILCICTSGRAIAQPAGDDCATAPVIECNSTTTFDNLLATTALDDPGFSCHFDGPGTQGLGTVWFSFVAADTSVFVQTCDSGGSGDTEIAVYDGTCGAFTELACDEDGCDPGFLSQVCASGLTIGNTYYIQVASYSEAQQGSITLDLTCPCPGASANDACEGAVDVACNTSITFENSDATSALDDPGFSCHFDGPGTQGVGTMWFTFVATDTSAQVETCDSIGSGDTEIAVYDGTCGALVELACSEDACGDFGLLSRACAEGLIMGNTYFVQVATYSEFNQGSITLDITCPCPAGPANDDCEAAELLACDSAVTFDNSLATINPADPLFSCGYFGPSTGAGSVWYTFVATHDSARLLTCDSIVQDTLIAVYDGVCGALLEIGCNEDECGLLSDVCVNGLVVGNTYFVQVASFGPASVGVITLELQCPCPFTCGSCTGDVNGDALVDGRDVQAFVACYLSGGESPDCACADIARNGAVDDGDVAPFVARLLENTGVCNEACPPDHEGQKPDIDTALNSTGNPFESADNFVAAADDTITDVRWWGPYAGEGCPTGGDTFRITYFNNFNGRPGDIKAGPFTVSPAREPSDLFIDDGVPLWVFDATHDPVAVTAGECVWLSIVNDRTAAGTCCLPDGQLGCDQPACQTCVCAIDDFCCEIGWDDICLGIAGDECAAECPDCSNVGGGEDCFWFWSVSQQGDGFLAQTGITGFWDFNSRLPGDLAWCLNIDIDTAVCPEPVGACCTGADCADTTQAACAGDWFPDFNCGEFTCPLAQFGACCAGDSCVFTQAVNCSGPFFVGQECDVFVCPVGSDDCCTAHPTPGCFDFTCETCVCDFDAFCCSGEWDEFCVGHTEAICEASCVCPVQGACCDGATCMDATDLTCAFEFFPLESCATFSCPSASGACCDDGVCFDTIAAGCFGIFFEGQLCENTFCPLDSGDCCVAHEGVGCQDQGCENCVCGLDSFCCDVEWDGVCVDQAQDDCPLDCTCVNPNDCCADNETPGCNNPVCESCVCAIDDFCCEDSWDATCVNIGKIDCFSECLCVSPNDCCADNETPGCNNAACQSCVCDLDGFCCNTAWDELCATRAMNDCPGVCGCP